MIKLIDAKYYDEDGTSEAIIATEIGNFYGYAFLHPEDESVKSNFLGCEIAEYRATIAYFKERLKRLNIELKTLYEIKNGFNQIVPVLVNKKIEQREQYKKEIKDNIKSLNAIIDNKVENRLIIIQKLEKRKAKRIADEQEGE